MGKLVHCLVILCTLNVSLCEYDLRDMWKIRVGGVFLSRDGQTFFREAIRDANLHRTDGKVSYEELLRSGVQDKTEMNKNMLSGETKLVASHYVVFDTNRVSVIKEICEYVMERNQGVHVIVWDSNDVFLTSLFAQAMSRMRVPMILTNYRHDLAPMLRKFPDSERESSTSTIFMQPTYGQEMRAILYLMEFYHWKYMVLIARNSHVTDIALKIIDNYIADNSTRVSEPFKYHAPILFNSVDRINQTVSQKLIDVREKNKVHLFVLLTSPDEAEHIFNISKELKLLEPKYAWVVSERINTGPILPHMPEGIVGFRANQLDDNGYGRIRDAIKMIVRAHTEETGHSRAYYVVQNRCDADDWLEITQNRTLAAPLLRQEFDGMQGLIRFDNNLLPGYRQTYNYSLVNLQKDSYGGSLSWKVMGEFRVQTNATLSLKSIKWIGGSSNAPSDKMGGSYRFVSVNEKPFIMMSNANITLDSDMPVSLIAKDEDGSICPGKSQVVCFIHSKDVTSETMYTTDYQVNCCTGVHVEFILELIESIYAAESRRPDFTYHIIENATYGIYADEYTGGVMRKRKFTGILGRVLEENFDLVFGPVTKTAERAKQFDSSHIYYLSKMVVVTKRRGKTSDPSSILRPFNSQVWYAIAISVGVVSVSLWFVEKYSPYGSSNINIIGENLPESSTFNATNSSWYTIGVLLGVALMSIVPRATSSKIISLVWSLFCLVALTTYTANLAAFMVSEKPTLMFVDGFLRDQRVKNPSDSFVISTVCDSFVIERFNNDDDYQQLASHLKKKCVATPDEGYNKIKTGEINAFLWDSGPSVYRILSDVSGGNKQCQLVISESFADTGGYAITGAKGSPFIELANTAILNTPISKFQDNYDKWLPESQCEVYEYSTGNRGFFGGYTNQITAEHATGILYVLIGGMILGGLLLPLETHFYKRYSNYFRGQRTAMLWNLLLDGKSGVLMSEKQRNEMLTNKVTIIRSQKDQLQETVYTLQRQIAERDEENDRLRDRLFRLEVRGRRQHLSPGGGASNNISTCASLEFAEQWEDD